MRREVPLLITAVVGITFVVKYFVPHFPFNRMDAWFADWFSIVQACAIVLGALNLLKLSALKVIGQKSGWGYALVIILSFMLITVIGLAEGSDYRDPGTSFDWLYVNMFIPLSATMFSILAFFVASASYRAFRARNYEATVLLIAAFFVMIGRVPVGDVITGFMPEGYRFSDLAIWIMDYPQTAGQRAIMIGIGLGVVSTSLRVILGIERAHIGTGD
ncbi:MAG: hypothetical protein JSW34_07575 [Candidatus Zixiibacteriota bacterium]|nr:MAG: hypothetical protein JSW34_07575 [candidate division Zixibacteria bacterium]